MVFNYFRLELKNCIKIIGRTVISICLVFLAVAALVFGCSYLLLHSSVFNKVNIAIALPEEKNDSKWALDFLLSTDSVESICDIKYFNDEAEAIDELKNGNVMAVISLPANFYEDVDTGVNTPVSIFIPEEISLNTSVFLELLGDGVDMLQISEAGVYATISTASELNIKRKNIGDDIAVLYLIAALDRNYTYKKNVVSATGEVDIYQYYFGAVIIIIMLFVSINFSYMYQKNNRALQQKLRVYGLNMLGQSAVRVAIMTFILWIFSLLCFVVELVISGILGTSFLEARVLNVFALLLVAFAVASFNHLVLSLVGYVDGAAGILIIVNVIMAILSGLVMPLAYFPRALQKLGGFMPVTAWNNFLLRALFENLESTNVFIIVVMSIVCLAIGTVVLCRKK